MNEETNESAFITDNLHAANTDNTYSGALSMFRRRYSRDLSNVDLAILGIPFDTATSNRPGARFGPRGVRAASAHLSWGRHWPWEFDVFQELAAVDYGDVFYDHGRQDLAPQVIEQTARDILNTDTALLSIGGDHFVTYPLLKAHAEKHGTLSLIHFDAHSDTWHEDEEDDRIDHGTMFYHAQKEGLVDPSRSVQVGLRTTNTETFGFNIIDAREACKLSAKKLAKRIKKVVGDHPVYLTFDIDCLDPSFAPGTGTPVCGGLSTRHALDIMWELRGINLIGMDLVEVAPAYDVGEITALAGANLALEFVHLMAFYRRERVVLV
uniref:Agmatinase (EC) n=1 Tax=uncultured Thiotrichaceae bacterium TaxID=298394 RepID=A0A6S6UG47_9GAMM|nr:MAG: Agmatinase (EC [uncultured Thiotrichaceae bacterium]